MNSITIICPDRVIYARSASGRTLLSIIQQEVGNIDPGTAVRIESGTASQITEKEKETLDSSRLAAGYRLASETYPLGNLTFYLDE